MRTCLGFLFVFSVRTCLGIFSVRTCLGFLACVPVWDF